MVMEMNANAHGIRKGGDVPIVMTGSLSSGLRGESCALDVWAHGSPVEDLSGSRISSTLNSSGLENLNIERRNRARQNNLSATRRRLLSGSENRLRVTNNA